ncbi:MAG: hypothetical protein WB699_07765, partial [Bacteroidota bacterium]
HALEVIRAHPVTAGASAFGGIVLIVLCTLLVVHKTVDTNVAFTTINTQNGTVSAYNAENQVLFSLPYTIVASHSGSRLFADRLQKQIVVARAAGSTDNILITSLTLGKELTSSPYARVKFLDGLGHEIKSFPPPDGHIAFRGRPYVVPLGAMQISVVETPPAGATEFFAVYSGARSPTPIQRNTVKGSAVGVFWHFGNLRTDTVDLNDDGHPELLLYGQNDVDDYKRVALPIIDIVDPSSIVGSTESSASRGFGLTENRGEQFYLSFPIPDAARLASVGMTVHDVAHLPDGKLIAFVAGNDGTTDDETQVGYDAIFEKSMRVLLIKPNNGLIGLHKKFFEQGKIASPLTDSYLTDLVSQVRYWNGSDWVSTPVRITQTASPSPIPSSH